MQNSQQLITTVNKICDELWKTMEATEYRDYIMGFLFYKYLSEASEKHFNDYKKRLNNISYQEFDENNNQYSEIKKLIFKDEEGFFIDYKYSFQNMVQLIKQDKNIISLLEEAFEKIEQANSDLDVENKDYFKDLFKSIDLTDKNLGNIDEEKEKTIRFIILEINNLKLNMEDSDHFGNVYEHLLSKFASASGKKSGEFYTPSSVAELIAKIATHNRTKIEKAYDPACGSGSLLIKLIRKVKYFGKIYGQEIKNATYNLARMNFILRGVEFSKISVLNGNTLLEPLHLKEKDTFDCIVANPPFSLKWNPSNNMLSQDIRFNPFPTLAPKKYADLAFLQHMLYHVKPKNGIIVSVFSLGVLHRVNPKAERDIRKYLIEKNYIDTIIFIPNKLFYNTSIQTCIIVARKDKSFNDKGIFMINARKEFKVAPNQNILSEKNISKIFETWRDKKEIENFSRYINYEEIVDNDYSLSMELYGISNKQEGGEIDIEKVELELAQIDKEIQEQEKLFKENLAKFEKELKEND
ncbi:type I restriction-modification system subunit M [[Mycoplasma] collis]|uniref:type I restriction-modification system subunit M n=1 Tax=[Mycoplasma] collis TaxID=2127 RepID=UPI000689DA3B|nr:type I restriction-modification system subunit M [[Mycoplasma] collis]